MNNNNVKYRIEPKDNINLIIIGIILIGINTFTNLHPFLSFLFHVGIFILALKVTVFKLMQDVTADSPAEFSQKFSLEIVAIKEEGNR